MVPRDRIELPSAPCKDAALPLDERGVGCWYKKSKSATQPNNFDLIWQMR